MLYLKIFFKSLIFCMSSILLLLAIYTLLGYFEIVSSSIFLILILIISLLISSFYLGSCAKEKGYLEGLKFGSIFSLITLIISLFTKPNIDISMPIYYLIIYITCILGSIIGINYKKTEN